jgi:hypothetical protein
MGEGKSIAAASLEGRGKGVEPLGKPLYNRITI